MRCWWAARARDHQAHQGAHPTDAGYYNTGITVTTVNLVDVQVPEP